MDRTTSSIVRDLQNMASPTASPGTLAASVVRSESARSAQSAENVERMHAHLEAEFKSVQSQHPDMALAVVGVHVLADWIRQSNASTMMELQIEVKAAADHIKSVASESLAVSCGCELFMRHVTRTTLEIPDFDACKESLSQRGHHYLEMTLKSRQKIAELGSEFVRDGSVVLVHGYSRCVQSLLLHAGQQQGKRFSVMVTESAGQGYQLARNLLPHGFPVTVIADTAIGSVMERVNVVLVGAEGVVENGGVLNCVGTFSLAVMAKALSKPFYVASESYKFARMYPLSQADVPNPSVKAGTAADASKLHASEHLEGLREEGLLEKLRVETPIRDYTPPEYITLMFTDLGVLTPSAVSDELIQLYY